MPLLSVSLEIPLAAIQERNNKTTPQVPTQQPLRGTGGGHVHCVHTFIQRTCTWYHTHSPPHFSLFGLVLCSLRLESPECSVSRVTAAMSLSLCRPGREVSFPLVEIGHPVPLPPRGPDPRPRRSQHLLPAPRQQAGLLRRPPG